LAYLLTDEMFGVAIARLRAGLAEEQQPWYALGTGLTLWLCWQASTLAGLLVGGEIPVGWSLDFAATLTFIALVVPMVRDRASVWCALVAAAVAVGALQVPLRLGLVAAALAGVLAGLAAERWERRPSRDRQTHGDMMRQESASGRSSADLTRRA
jgi:predicted branched-subunit amino acid permease